MAFVQPLPAEPLPNEMAFRGLLVVIDSGEPLTPYSRCQFTVSNDGIGLQTPGEADILISRDDLHYAEITQNDREPFAAVPRDFTNSISIVSEDIEYDLRLKAEDLGEIRYLLDKFFDYDLR